MSRENYFKTQAKKNPSLQIAILDNTFHSYHQEEKILAPLGEIKIVHESSQNEEDIIAVCRHSSAILVNEAKLTAKVLSHCKQCRIICRYGTGIDNIDSDFCLKQNIVIKNVTHYCAEEVSLHALTLLFMGVRQLIKTTPLSSLFKKYKKLLCQSSHSYYFRTDYRCHWIWRNS